ncbi:MAG: 3'(2'),5'-bisphosphate nucleotidase CysQ [Actinobacteria bacterium]|nr:3'(2'),5'-bisphosphate nucleotidase CysQ [Actinomycetota bacterium]
MSPDDRAVAITVAAAARDLLVRRREELAAAGVAPDRWGVAGDAEANEAILGHLAALRPHDAVLSEESADDPVRLDRQRVWIVDPLDGTREYATPGRGDWAVHVALAVDGLATIGAVALPDGRILNGSVPATAPGPRSRRRLVVSRSRPPAVALAVAAALDLEVVELGSAGAKVASVIDGVHDAYLHAGGMQQWDSAAPVAAAVGAGLWASRVDGSPLRYNGADPSVPDLLVCRPELAPSILDAVARSGRIG